MADIRVLLVAETTAVVGRLRMHAQSCRVPQPTAKSNSKIQMENKQKVFQIIFLKFHNSLSHTNLCECVWLWRLKAYNTNSIAENQSSRLGRLDWGCRKASDLHRRWLAARASEQTGK